jgi:hypothetical protein
MDRFRVGLHVPYVLRKACKPATARHVRYWCRFGALAVAVCVLASSDTASCHLPLLVIMRTTCSGLTLQLHLEPSQQIVGEVGHLHHRGSLLCLDALSRSQVQSRFRGYHPQDGAKIDQCSGLAFDGSFVTCFDLTPWRFWSSGHARKDRFICSYAIQGEDLWDAAYPVEMVEVGLSGLTDWGRGALRQPRFNQRQDEDAFSGDFVGPSEPHVFHLKDGRTIDIGWSESYMSTAFTAKVRMRHYFRMYGDGISITPSDARTFVSRLNLLLMLFSGRASWIQFIRFRDSRYRQWNLWSSSLGWLHDLRRSRYTIGDIPLRELQPILPDVMARWLVDPNPLERPTLFYLSMAPDTGPFNEAAAMGVFSSVEALCRDSCEGLQLIDDDRYETARRAIKSSLKESTTEQVIERLLQLEPLGGQDWAKWSNE